MDLIPLFTLWPSHGRSGAPQRAFGGVSLPPPRTRRDHRPDGNCRTPDRAISFFAKNPVCLKTLFRFEAAGFSGYSRPRFASIPSGRVVPFLTGISCRRILFAGGRPPPRRRPCADGSRGPGSGRHILNQHERRSIHVSCLVLLASLRAGNAGQLHRL